MAFKSLPKRLEKWAEERVPGLGTYLKRENLRDADKLIRDELAERLDQVKGVLDKAKQKRVDAGSLKNLDRLDRATRKIEKVRDTIKFDSRGYRGVFDPEEVGETELMMLLDFDEKLFDVIENLDVEAGRVAELSDVELLDRLSQFEDQVEAMDETLGRRENYAKDNLPGS
jgi:hypothetical protein